MSLRKKITKSHSCVVLLCALSVFIFRVADYLTNIDINLAIFYLFPTCLVTWFAGRNEEARTVTLNMLDAQSERCCWAAK